MTDVLEFPTNRVRGCAPTDHMCERLVVTPQGAAYLAARARDAVVGTAPVARARRVNRASAASRPTTYRVADLLLQMENRPFDPPLVHALRGADGRAYVRVTLGHDHRVLMPDEARLLAQGLFYDPPFEGAAGVAAQLNDAADRSERQWGRAAPPHRTSRLTLIALGALLAFVGLLASLSDRTVGF